MGMAAAEQLDPRKAVQSVGPDLRHDEGASPTSITSAEPGRVAHPAVLALDRESDEQGRRGHGDADNLLLAFAGVFSGTPAEGLTQTVLIKSSKNSQLVDPMMAQMGGEKIIKTFSASNTEQAACDPAHGQIQDGLPRGQTEGRGTKPDEPPKPEEKKEEKPAEEGLKESAQENAVVLIGDADLIQDQIAVTEAMNPFGGQRMVMPLNGNLAFAQGAVEQLTGDNNLIAVRSRASRERPFTVVREMQAERGIELPQQNQRPRSEPCGGAAQIERTAAFQSLGRRPAFHPFARAAAGDREFPQEGDRSEEGTQTGTQKTARRYRLARKPHQVDEHRRHARTRRRLGRAARHVAAQTSSRSLTLFQS